jgi:hypothetical protein
MLDPSCRLTTDQGSEWARLPQVFASAATVNHSIEWVAQDGTTTNLGEAYNGIIKKLGSELHIWKGRVSDDKLETRWHELAWRINSGFNKSNVPAGSKLIGFLNVLTLYQSSTAGSSPPVCSEARRAAEMRAITVPSGEHRVRRFPSKRQETLKECWRTLRGWLKSGSNKLELPGLSKAQRFYCHQWSECFHGILHSSSGSEANRVLVLTRGQRVYLKQLRVEPENHPDDAEHDA